MARTYDHAGPVSANGQVFRSQTEALWSLLLFKLNIPHSYEPMTFEFPDGSIYTPDFCLTAVNRFIEVKNRNANNDTYQKLNKLAHHLGRHTILLDGSPKNASAFVFDGRPPEENWEDQEYPVEGIAFEEIYGHNAAVVVNRLLQPDAYSPIKFILPRPQLVNQLVEASKLEIDYQVTDAQKEELRHKLFDPTRPRTVLPVTPVVPGRFTSAPPRRTSHDYGELDPVDTNTNIIF